MSNVFAVELSPQLALRASPLLVAYAELLALPMVEPEITSERELEGFLGDLFNGVAKAAGGFIRSPAGQAWGGDGRPAAKRQNAFQPGPADLTHKPAQVLGDRVEEDDPRTARIGSAGSHLHPDRRQGRGGSVAQLGRARTDCCASDVRGGRVLGVPHAPEPPVGRRGLERCQALPTTLALLDMVKKESGERANRRAGHRDLPRQCLSRVLSDCRRNVGDAAGPHARPPYRRD